MSEKPIESFMGIKIRKIFKSLYGRKGYPYKIGHYVSYTCGISLWVPKDWIIDEYYTITQWYKGNGFLRKVWIFYLHPDVGNNDALMLDDESAEAFQINVGTMIANEVLSQLPYVGRSLDTLFDMDVAANTRKEIGLFENLTYYTTIHDDIIKANWDKVAEVLDKNGYWVDKPQVIPEVIPEIIDFDNVPQLSIDDLVTIRIKYGPWYHSDRFNGYKLKKITNYHTASYYDKYIYVYVKRNMYNIVTREVMQNPILIMVDGSEVALDEMIYEDDDK